MHRREGIRLGSYHGAPIILAYSWFLALAFVLFVFGPRFSLSGGQGYVLAALYALMLLFSVFVHELAHAVTARSFGCTVQRITLNLWGGFTQFTENKASPARSLLISLVGPASNFMLALAVFFALVIVTPENYIITAAFDTFFWMNIVLGFFNIIPAAPLDGGRIVETFVWKLTGNRGKGMIGAGWAGRIITAVLLVMTLAPLMRGQQIRVTTLAVTMIVVSMVWVGATQTIQAGRIMTKITVLSAEALARKALIVDPRTSITELKRLMAEVSYRPFAQVFAVTDREGRITAVVNDEAVASIPERHADSLRLESVLQTIMPAKAIPLDLSGQELLQEVASVDSQDIRYYILTDGHGSHQGVLDRQTVIEAIQP